MMLPMASGKADEIALDYYLTLAVLRSGVGSQYHLGSIAQATYMAMLLSRTTEQTARPELFRAADEAILHCRKVGLETGIWRVDEGAFALLGKVLSLFDQQLAVASVRELAVANEKLKKIFSAMNTGCSSAGEAPGTHPHSNR